MYADQAETALIGQGIEPAAGRPRAGCPPPRHALCPLRICARDGQRPGRNDASTRSSSTGIRGSWAASSGSGWSTGSPAQPTDGRQYFVYGGDFGEEIHDGNFVTDGLVDADRKPRPGLLDFKKVIEPLAITVAADWTRFTVASKFDFADTSVLRFRYSVEADGGTLDGGLVAVAPLAPRSETTVQLPAGLAALAGDAAAVLTVRAELAEATEWADAGHEVAWGQAFLNAPAAPQVRATESAVVPDAPGSAGDAAGDGPAAGAAGAGTAGTAGAGARPGPMSSVGWDRPPSHGPPAR